MMILLLYALLTACVGAILLIWWEWNVDFSHRKYTQKVDRPILIAQKGDEKDEDVEEEDVEEINKPHSNRGKRGSCHSSQEIHLRGENDMDDLYICFFDFLLYIVLILPSQQFVFWKEFFVLNIRRIINSKIVSLKGTRFMTSWHPEEIAGRMLLETSEMIYYVGQTTGDDGVKTANYEWEDFVVLDNQGGLRTADKVVMQVDLESKLFIAGEIDGKELKSCEAVQLLAMHVTLVIHPALHTYATWGIDSTHPNAFVRRMAKVTVIYNYFGSTWFPRSTAPFLVRWGKIFDEPRHHDITENTRRILHSEWQKGLPCRRIPEELIPYSSLAEFVSATCESFCNIFERYKDEFVGIDREAMFTATILHSLDHTMLTRVVEDPLWLFVDTTEYSAAGKLAAFACACLSRDLPGLLFRKRFKDASHPFYKEVYDEAKKVNAELADLIDTCIIK